MSAAFKAPIKTFINRLWAYLINNYFILAIPLSAFIFYGFNYFEAGFEAKSLPLVLSICGYLIIKGQKAKDIISSYSKGQKAIILLISIYATFAFVGHRLFLYEYPLTHKISKIAYFILFFFWLLFMSVAFLTFTEICRQKVIDVNNKKSDHSTRSSFIHFLTFFGIVVAGCIIYLIAFFPAVMTADSIDQWQQALGTIKYNDWHPVFHTLFNKLFISIYKSPASAVLGQILFMALVAAGFFFFLYKKGIPLKWLIGATLVFAIIPVNGIMSVTLWKDIPFTIAMLWLTLVLMKIATNDSYLKEKWAYAELIPALVAAALFRHNGMFVYALTIIALLLIFFKTKKPAIVICVIVSIGIVAWYKVHMSDPERVLQNPPAIKLVAPMHGIAAARYYKGYLAQETVAEMDKIMPDSMWLTRYRPYSADEYLFNTNRLFVENLSVVPTSRVLHLYENTLLRNPYLVTRDRLCGSEILWNVFEANGSFNYRYYTDVMDNDQGIPNGDNKLKKALIKVLDLTVNKADFLFWRSGVYNILMFLLLFLFGKQSRKYLLIFIPFIACDLSLEISVTYQSFRYVYYIPMLFGFLWLSYLSNVIPAANTDRRNMK